MSGNGLRLLPSLLRPLRSPLLLLLEHLPLESTAQDGSVRRAIVFLLAHKNSRSELLPIAAANGNSESAVCRNRSHGSACSRARNSSALRPASWVSVWSVML